MSRLRKQLLEKLPELQKQAKHLQDKDAKRRWNLLRYVCLSGSSVKSACARVGCSADFFSKWAGLLLKGGSLLALKTRSRAPRRRPNKTKPLWEKRICEARAAQPYIGCERLSQRLDTVYGKKLAPSTVNRILNSHSMVSKVKSKKLTKKHLKRYRRPLPGYLQMDFKYVPYLIEGKQYYQLSCIDHHSSWRMIRVYPNKNIEAVESFLIELSHQCPFSIIELQTDNDLAFTHKFWKLRMGFDPTNEHPLVEWCIENGVEPRLIPVGEKELNGKVENSHKQDDREFFSQINPQNLSHLQALSLVYQDRWNKKRVTKALEWKTPQECIEFAYVKAAAIMGLWGIRPLPNVINIPKQKPVKRVPDKQAKKSKRKTFLNRYLLWMDEDEKKYGT